MGWKKKFKKYVNPHTYSVGAYKGAKGALGTDDKSGDDYRAEAAAVKVKKDQQRQGGGGQVNFTTETYE